MTSLIVHEFLSSLPISGLTVLNSTTTNYYIVVVLHFPKTCLKK